MVKRKIAERLDQYGNFHDSRVKQIFLETNHRILSLVIDYAHDSAPSPTGEMVVPDERKGAPQRYNILYKPATILFKDVAKIIVKTEPDPVNEEIILSCQLVEDGEEEPPETDFVHVELTLTSLSKLDIFCRDLECKTL